MDTEAISPRERRSHKPRRSKKLLERLAAEDDRLGRGSADDRAFFENNPDREYRARLATPFEVAAFEMRVEAPMPGGLFLWTLVHQIIPGIRMRRYVAGGLPVGPRADIDEETARALFVAVEEADA
jgi:hypothetical protein